MRLKKKNYIHIAVLTALYLLLVLVLTRFRYAYGSQLDWSAQHFAIPDIFRKQFYKTGELFPSFVFNLGAGENIYNLSYYGLYSPIILLSYLFPFVPMYVYIQIVSILGVCVSIFLFYRWTNGKFGGKTAFVLTVMFEFSSGLTVHSHRHIMFVSYMPFLLLAFNAVDDYFRGKRKFALVIYTFLCIMCCYFFGVAAVAAIVVYGVYEYLRTTDKVTLRDLWKKGTHFAGMVITAVMMSGVLIIPTLYCLLKGRDAGNSRIDLSLLLPKSSLDFFCYNSYGIGLTIISVLAVISAVVSKNKKHTRFLGISMLCLLLLPMFVYALNGTLYIDSKVLIPFMPICLLLVGRLFEQIGDKTFAWKLCMPLTAAMALWYYLGGSNKKHFWTAFFLDAGIMLAAALIGILIKKKKVVQLGTMVCAVMLGLVVNFDDKLTELSQLDRLFSDDMYSLVQETCEDSEIVRTANLVDRSTTPNYIYSSDQYVSTLYSSLHNKRYNGFYFNRIKNENEFRNSALTTQSQSIVYQMYMGTKYIISDDKTKVPVMYKKIKQAGEFTLYENEKALPVGYCTSQTLNEMAFTGIRYPQSLCALMSNIVVEEGGAESFECGNIKQTESFEIKGVKGVAKTDKGYMVRLEKAAEFTAELKEAVDADKLLLVAFEVDNDFRQKGMRSADAKILINGIKNNLTNPSWKYYNNNTTFEYVVASYDDEPLKELNIRFERGNYDIKNIRCYTLTPDLHMPVDRFEFDKQKTKGDDIVGSIDVTKDGYFMLSVPYADGFTAYVDGEKTEVECVDTAFIGFPLSQGHHEIKINFTAPLRNEGLLVSAGGIVIFAILIIFERFSKRKKNEDVKE